MEHKGYFVCLKYGFIALRTFEQKSGWTECSGLDAPQTDTTTRAPAISIQAATFFNPIGEICENLTQLGEERSSKVGLNRGQRFVQCKIVSLRARRSGKLSRDLTSKLIAPTCTTPPQTAVFPPGGILPPSSFHKTQEKQPGLKQNFVFVHALQIRDVPL